MLVTKIGDHKKGMACRARKVNILTYLGRMIIEVDFAVFEETNNEGHAVYLPWQLD